MPRRLDQLRLELLGSDNARAGVVDNFTALRVTLDLEAPFEATVELGDAGTFEAVGSRFAQATRARVVLNGRPLLTGRIEAQDVPVDAAGGATMRFTVRTVLSDAMYASADPSTGVRGATLKDFILALYKPFGLAEQDFTFRASEARELLTGVQTRGTGDDPTIRLERLKVEEARVRAPETVYAAADRHLRRFGLMHWDSPTGGIVVGFPNQGQRPSYTLHASRNRNTSANNSLGSTRQLDWSGVPSHAVVAGRGGKRDFSAARVTGTAVEQDVAAAGLHRPVFVLADGIRNEEAARNAAEHELAIRVRRKDSAPHELDGLSHWDGQRQRNYGVDTVLRYVSDVAGGDLGPYYVHRVELSRDANAGDKSRLSTLRAGLWRLFPAAFEGRLG